MVESNEFLQEAEALLSATSEQRIFEATVNLAWHRLPADRCKVATIDDNHLVIQVETGNGTNVAGHRIPLDETELGAAIKQGRSFTLDDMTHVRSASGSNGGSEAFRSIACTPIDDFGLLLAVAIAPGKFTDDHLHDLELLSTFAEAALRRYYRTATRPQNGELLEEVASILSHDVKSPLAIAEGNLELERESNDSTYLETTTSALERLETMLDDLVTLARTGDRVDPSDAIDLQAIAEQSWELVETNGATLSIQDSATFQGDESRLRHVFENLFRNAVNHAGPTVSIRVGVLSDGEGLFIEDDGPGVPEDRRNRVFEYGHSSTVDQPGFGLSIVQRIVEAHGWAIRLTESQLGGARFEITGMRVE